MAAAGVAAPLPAASAAQSAGAPRTKTTKMAAAMNSNGNGNTAGTTARSKADKTRTREMNEALDRLADEAQLQMMLQNFDDEARLRKQLLEASTRKAETQLVEKLNSIVFDLDSRLQIVTAHDFVHLYKCDIAAALRAVADGSYTASGSGSGSGSSSSMPQQRQATLEEDTNDEIARTAKKRKRIFGGNNGELSAMHNMTATDDEAAGAGATTTGSPFKARKNMRIAPPTPKLGTTTSSTTGAFPRSASKQGLSSRAQHQQQQPVPSTSSTTNASRSRHSSMSSTHNAFTSARNRPSNAPSVSSARISNAGNFIYKARPSLAVPTNYSAPRLPQTPKTYGAGANRGIATAAGMSTARRLPRRNECVQAYSVNGSPLGTFDLAVEEAAKQQAQANAQAQARADEKQHQQQQLPTSESSTVPSASGGESEEDWEMLSNRTAASVAPNTAASSNTLHSGHVPQQQQQQQASAQATPLAKVSPSKLGRKPSHSAFKDKILAGASKAFGGHGGSRFQSPRKQQQQQQQQQQAATTISGTSGYGLTRPPSRDEFTFSAGPPLPSIPSQSGSLNSLDTLRAELAEMCPNPEQRRIFEQKYLDVMRAARNA